MRSSAIACLRERGSVDTLLIAKAQPVPRPQRGRGKPTGYVNAVGSRRATAGRARSVQGGRRRCWSRARRRSRVARKALRGVKRCAARAVPVYEVARRQRRARMAARGDSGVSGMSR
eukprot:6191650-Pleurochrysis_carterae.AAC.1